MHGRIGTSQPPHGWRHGSVHGPEQAKCVALVDLPSLPYHLFLLINHAYGHHNATLAMRFCKATSMTCCPTPEARLTRLRYAVYMR